MPSFSPSAWADTLVCSKERAAEEVAENGRWHFPSVVTVQLLQVLPLVLYCSAEAPPNARSDRGKLR